MEIAAAIQVLGKSLGLFCKIKDKIKEYRELGNYCDDFKGFVGRQRRMIKKIESQYDELVIFRIAGIPDTLLGLTIEHMGDLSKLLHNYKMEISRATNLIAPLDAARNRTRFSQLSEVYAKIRMTSGGVSKGDLGSYNSHNLVLLRLYSEANAMLAEIEDRG